METQVKLGKFLKNQGETIKSGNKNMQLVWGKENG